MAQTYWKTDAYVTNWDEFDEQVRSKGWSLLNRLDEFPNSVLVTGCQRSGTTMLTRVITQSDGMVNYWFGTDDELDAALILSGYVDHTPAGRYCFQTTYVNQHYPEYYEHPEGHKLIFVLRNPFSVIYSMLYNWREHALNRFFRFNGIHQASGLDKHLYGLFGMYGVSKLRRACWGYIGKVSQLFELQKNLSPDRLIIVDYDDLVVHKEVMLPLLYDFIDLPFKQEYAERIHSKSVSKIAKLSRRESLTIKSLCVPIYQAASKLRTQQLCEHSVKSNKSEAKDHIGEVEGQP